MTWIQDEAFIRGNLPMTKFEIRVVTMALLDIEPGDVLLDIGAGTGSISIQAALLGAEIYAIEREREGIEVIRQNAEKFGVTLHTVHQSAPEGIDAVPEFQKCFIGGSRGNLEQIVETVHFRLPSGGILVANFVKLANMVTFQRQLQAYTYQQLETRLIQTARVDRLGMFRGNNPVFIVKARKP